MFSLQHIMLLNKISILEIHCLYYKRSQAILAYSKAYVMSMGFLHEILHSRMGAAAQLESPVHELLLKARLGPTPKTAPAFPRHDRIALHNFFIGIYVILKDRMLFNRLYMLHVRQSSVSSAHVHA